MIESFDWRTLQLVQKEAPTISTVYLTQQERPEENIYLDKPSPWTAGFDPRNYGGSVPRAVKAPGAKIWSPLYSAIDPHSLAQAPTLALPATAGTGPRVPLNGGTSAGSP